jgi:hypothetical protein
MAPCPRPRWPRSSRAGRVPSCISPASYSASSSSGCAARCPQQAAALTYQTTLSLVPLLALVFAGRRLPHNLDVESRFVDFITFLMRSGFANVNSSVPL